MVSGNSSSEYRQHGAVLHESAGCASWYGWSRWLERNFVSFKPLVTSYFMFSKWELQSRLVFDRNLTIAWLEWNEIFHWITAQRQNQSFTGRTRGLIWLIEALPNMPQVTAVKSGFKVTIFNQLFKGRQLVSSAIVNVMRFDLTT